MKFACHACCKERKKKKLTGRKRAGEEVIRFNEPVSILIQPLSKTSLKCARKCFSG